VQVAVELEDVQLLVVLEFVCTIFRDLDDSPEDLGRAFTNGELQIINHSVSTSSRGWVRQAEDAGDSLDAHQSARFV